MNFCEEGKTTTQLAKAIHDKLVTDRVLMLMETATLAVTRKDRIAAENLTRDIKSSFEAYADKLEQLLALEAE